MRIKIFSVQGFVKFASHTQAFIGCCWEHAPPKRKKKELKLRMRNTPDPGTGSQL